jgi:DNA polymerase II small subunit
MVVEVIKNYSYIPSKFEVSDFAEFFKTRYKSMKNLLFNRVEARDAISINYAKSRSERGAVTIIAMIKELQKLPTGTVKLVLEDLSGTIDAIVSKKSENFKEMADFLCEDEVVAFNGSISRNTMFINHIIYPDVSSQPMKYSEEEVCVAFTGDIHAGSNEFLPEKFQKFINWLKGEEGDERQRELAKKTKYIFIIGDIVDGIGIYPEQYKGIFISNS